MKVLGMGNALVDVLAKISDDSILKNLELPKGSMQLINEEKREQLNAALIDTEKHIASGGSASNTITAIGKLGVQAGFLGKIGKDSFGQHFKSDINKYNVESHLIEVDNAASGIATTFISEDGERTFGTYLGAAATLSAEELHGGIFEGYKYLYIEGYLVQNLDLIRTAITLAKEQGLQVVLDLASYNVVEDTRDFLEEIIPQYVDIIFANEEEAKALVGLEGEDAVDALAKDVNIAIVKTGAKGSWIKKGPKKVFIPALVVNCVDTTGAGDLYAAGFLYGLIKGYTLQKSGEIGTILAGNVIQVIGPKMTDDHWAEITKNSFF